MAQAFGLPINTDAAKNAAVDEVTPLLPTTDSLCTVISISYQNVVVPTQSTTRPGNYWYLEGYTSWKTELDLGKSFSRVGAIYYWSNGSASSGTYVRLLESGTPIALVERVTLYQSLQIQRSGKYIQSRVRWTMSYSGTEAPSGYSQTLTFASTVAIIASN